MSYEVTRVSASPNTTSTDLWKFFEEKGAQQKESLFKLVTWIVGLAAVMLGFAVKEGFEKGLEKVAHPFMVIVLGFAGLAVIFSTYFIICDHGRHINRTFARADAARNGDSAHGESGWPEKKLKVSGFHWSVVNCCG